MKALFFALFVLLVIFSGCLQEEECTSLEDVETAFQEEGRCLVIVEGNVYDVTDSSDWAEGTHKKAHPCGQEYDAETIQIGPHGVEVLDPFFTKKLCK